jgi:hypothetical protein
MFATPDGTIDPVRERRRAARRRELRSLCVQEARIKQRVTQIVREADDDGDWRAAGCSSSAQWLAQLSSSDYRSAQRITATSSALRGLPALDHAMSTGALSLDQVAAAAEFATAASDAALARLAVGKPPNEIGLVARTIVPPTVADDQQLYERRALRMTWTRGRRELHPHPASQECPGGGGHCERVPPLVFRPALRIHEAKTSRFGMPRVVVCLIWSVQTLDNAAMTANVR